MNYIIEGTISELSIDENFFRIKGSEGFVIIQDNKKYNVLCPESMQEKVDVSFILSQDAKFSVGRNENLLIKACHSENKIKIKFENLRKDDNNNTVKEIKEKLSAEILSDCKISILR